MVLDLLDPATGRTYLDAGCGDGRVMRSVGAVGARVIGCDVNLELLQLARAEGPVVGCRLPGLDWIRPASVDGAYASLVVEHLVDLEPFFGWLWHEPYDLKVRWRWSSTTPSSQPLSPDRSLIQRTVRFSGGGAPTSMTGSPKNPPGRAGSPSITGHSRRCSTQRPERVGRWSAPSNDPPPPPTTPFWPSRDTSRVCLGLRWVKL